MFTELRDTWGERWPGEIAHVYSWIGDTDSAFTWLEKELLVNGLGGIMIDPYFTGLHEDRRWQPLLEKAGLSVADSDSYSPGRLLSTALKRGLP